MLRTSRAQRLYTRLFVTPAARAVHRSGIGASALSLFAILTACAGGVSFVFEPALGGALYLFSGILDTLDGAVARLERDSSRAGAFLDSVLDRYAELLAFLGVLGFYARVGTFTPALVFSTLLAGYGAVMTSYAQARAEGLGSSCSYGFFERPERMLVLGGGAIASYWIEVSSSLPDFLQTRPVLGAAVLVLAIGSNTTAFTRLIHGYRRLESEDREAVKAPPQRRSRR